MSADYKYIRKKRIYKLNSRIKTKRERRTQNCELSRIIRTGAKNLINIFWSCPDASITRRAEAVCFSLKMGGKLTSLQPQAFPF